MAPPVLAWSGPMGGAIGVGFDDKNFSLKEMQTEIASAGEAHPNLPDEVPRGTRFAFAKDGTGHLTGRFRVGDTVYRDVAPGSSLHPLWDTVHLIDQLLHPERYRSVS